MKSKIIFSSGLLGALLFIVASILGGLQIEGYDLISQYISESYATGLPNTTYLRKMYIVSGACLACFALLTASVKESSTGLKIGLVLFGIFYGFGTMVTGFFPCDIGCPSDSENATVSQFIHNAAGFLTYSVVPFCLLGIGVASRKLKGGFNISAYSLVCGAVALVFVVLLFGNPKGAMIGLFQRIIEGAILFWVIRTALIVLKTDSKAL